MGNYSSALTADVEDFKSIVSTFESQCTLIENYRLEKILSVNHATAEEPEGQEMNEVQQEPDLKFLYSNTKDITEPVNNCSSAPKPVVSSSSSSCSGTNLPQSLNSLLSAALSASLPAKPRGNLQGPVTMEQMKADLRELRDELDQLKTQHKKEITLLMNELDEEKKMRLSLQIDVERLKKHMSK
ncbi:SH3 domain-containing kinase-binding protein 1 [Myxocyprinus asiaticus]|uniref:SH3 domain-containing kinase-binding protein 1 n=1 Tax=Myxocyprinus asiaticus TaxID=70543 RepID=UPI002222B3CD|nr:SH3 domain-containing kinase-binding protein 1 [Myxocyprinus asiaticus]